jgi:nitrite reductase (NO-forming)
MQKTLVLGAIAVVVGLSGFAVGNGRQSQGQGAGQQAPTFEVDGKVFGTREAEVFTEKYDGPAVSGEYVTMAPYVAPLPPGNRTHHVRMDVVVQTVEVAPGVRYQAWTFGGTVPGPVIHVREGDRVIFTMKNRSAEAVKVSQPSKDATAPFYQQLAESGRTGEPGVMPMPHSMDFHAGTVSPNDKWRMIQAGETIRMEWVANYPGVFTYHCGVPPVLQHAAMGQYGVVIVSPKDGYPTDGDVDKEYVIVQSELYLKEGPDGLYLLDYEAAMKKQPALVVFNGHRDSMMTKPLKAEVGDRVRYYVHNVGPSDTSSIHVIGAIFDRVFYEGGVKNESRGMQTVLLGASNGAVLEYIVPEPGNYILVDHEFADAMKGAMGKLVAGSMSPTVTEASVHGGH